MSDKMDQIQALPDLATISAIAERLAPKIDGLDSTELPQLIGIEISKAGISQLTNRVFDHIQHLISPDEYGVRSHIEDLLTRLLYEFQLKGTALEPLLSVLRTIRSSPAPKILRKTGKPLDWHSLIEAACIYARLSPPFAIDENWWKSFPRHHAVGQAALRLRDRGYDIQLEDQGITIGELEYRRLIANIENLVQTTGGLRVARHIFHVVTYLYDHEMERFHITRSHKLGTFPTPAIPLGYLLSLAAKYLSSRGKSTDYNASLRELILLATDFAAIHDVQEYSPLLFSRPSAGELPTLLAKRALADSFFTFPQMSSQHADRIIKGILSALPADVVNAPGWTLADLFAVSKTIYAYIEDKRGPQIFNIRSIIRNVPDMHPSHAKFILLDVFSHLPIGPNQKFSSPIELTSKGGDPLVGSGNNLHFRPLIRLGHDSVAILDRSVVGPAIIEAILSAMRGVVGGSFQNDVVGPGLENFVRSELISHGVTTVTGDYDSSINGECDLVVETSDRLAFIELKAKALTRNANAGSDVDVTLSLAASVIAAQQQAMGHEIQLRKHKILTLIDRKDNAKSILKWRNQTVDRIALGIFDFGAFQDKMMVANLLNHVAGANYEAVDENVKSLTQKEFKKLNVSLRKLTEHISTWQELSEEACDPFSDCWFISAPQLLFLLEGVNEPDDFFRNLDKIRRLTFQTCNFYFEYKHASNLDKMRKFSAL